MRLLNVVHIWRHISTTSSFDSSIPATSEKVTFIFNDYPAQAVQIALAPELIEWVIENICKNAADAMKGKGEITISITEDISKVILNITDNGEGVNRSILKNIFKPGVTSKKRGWGLGLALVKRIICEHHKGKVFVLKSKIDFGTTIRITLPVGHH